MKKIISSLIICFIGIEIAKTQTIETDRPDQTEASSTVPKGAFQIETGIQIEHYDEFNQNRRDISHPNTLFRLGLLDWIELRGYHEYNSRRISSANELNNWKTSGMGDIELGTKIQLLDKEDVNTQIAFMSHVALPTGSIDFAGEEYATINRFLISHNFGKFNIAYNLGMNYAHSDNYQYIYTLALAHSITDHFNVYVEPFGEIDQNGEVESSFDAGIAYLLNDKMQVDFAFGTGINHYMNYVTIGFSVLILKEEEEK